MIALMKNHLRFTKILAYAITLVFSYAIAATTIAQSEQVRSDKFIAVSEGVTLRVIEAGPIEAQTIVLIPGWCFTAEIWNKQIAALGDRYHIVAFDPRSQGGSTIINHSNSPDNRATDIANLIKKLHLQKPVLVGWSQGVQDVAAYTLIFGTNEIGGIVLVDATVSGGASGLDSKMAGMVLSRIPIYVSSQRDYIEGMIPYVFNKPLSPAELNTIVNAALQTPSSIGVTNLILDLFGKDYRPAYKRINVPTLLIIAGTAENKHEQKDQPIPNSTTVVIDGAGHAVFYDEPAKFNEAITKFLDRDIKQ